MNRKMIVFILVPVIVSVVFVVLNLFPFFQTIEIKFFDALLHIKPEIKENPAILFVNIDEDSIGKVGLYPWGRDILADGLILMKEFDVQYVLFDIEYLNPSPKGVNGVYLSDTVPGLFAAVFSEINKDIRDLVLAVKNRQFPLKDTEEYLEMLESDNNTKVMEKLLGYVNEIARDNDEYLGQAAHFTGKAFFTVNLPTAEEAIESTLDVPDEAKQYALEYISIKNIRVNDPLPYISNIIKPAILPILKKGAGAGYPNVVIDEDGVLRRIDVIRKYENHYFAQLTFAPLLDLLGNPDIEVNKNTIILKNARIPGKDPRDITIPLTEDRRVLINWLKDDFNNSFKHLSYYNLVEHKKLEQDLVYNLFKIMKPAGFLNYYQGENDLSALYHYAEDIKKEILAGGDTSGIHEYREVRDYFFKEVGIFLNGQAENQMIRLIDDILSRENLGEDERVYYTDLRSYTIDVFAKTKKIYDDLINNREVLEGILPGSFSIIGWTGISTTDIGVTAFEKEYMNVGVHASILNTILQEDFLDILPWWVSAIIAAAVAFLVALSIRNLKPLFSIIVGAGFVVGIILCISVFFYFTGIYTNLLTPTLVCFFTFIIRTFIVFMETEKEKTFIRGAFSQYLSTDVVNEVISSPDKLHLGGVKKYITALFTDIRGFSSISEQLDPSDLVKLLNHYLTEMSNIILSQKGTIDKYEGDAIISFFGAPLSFTDHAEKACLSAARMKRMERLLNDHFDREKLSPAPLYTRIGINTGEMVVGNMGTEKKMDYTIMGNAVNLAARLEGVNKLYGTWILIAEQTQKEGCNTIITRKLDKVRVVGIETPVRLYEIIDEKEMVKPEVIEALETFQEALVAFEKKEWEKALKIFEAVQKILPDDGPSRIYVERCTKYLKESPPDNWDGVFDLKMK
ncbi:MAG: CHASE2 domain-containing protein [Spirochaetales bacterium]|nr:CHASE2 domain-containing protein [Spirochaetales bacterium]